MTRSRRRFAALGAAYLGIVLGVLSRAAPAHADAGLALPAGVPLSIDEPRSGIHLEVEGACLARPKDAGAGVATCPELDVATTHSEVVAVVAGEGNSAGYSVDIVVEDLQPGSGEERARRLASEIGEALAEPPTVVTFGDQRFVRARIRSKVGGGVCFVTADDRREVAAIVFLGLDTESSGEVETKADVAMGTLRRAAIKPRKPSDGTTGGGEIFFYGIFVLALGLFGLFVFAKFVFIARLFGFTLGGADRPIEEPQRPRDPRDDGPQVAGMKCAACKRNIVSDFEGMQCRDCDRPVHKKCHGRHVTDAHAPTAGAYR